MRSSEKSRRSEVTEISSWKAANAVISAQKEGFGNEFAWRKEQDLYCTGVLCGGWWWWLFLGFFSFKRWRDEVIIKSLWRSWISEKKTGRFFFVNSWDYNFKTTVYNSYFESNQRETFQQKPCKLLEIHWLTDLGGRVLGSYFQICHYGIHPGKLTLIKVPNPDEFSGFQRGFHVSVFGG